MQNVKRMKASETTHPLPSPYCILVPPLARFITPRRHFTSHHVPLPPPLTFVIIPSACIHLKIRPIAGLHLHLLTCSDVRIIMIIDGLKVSYCFVMLTIGHWSNLSLICTYRKLGLRLRCLVQGLPAGGILATLYHLTVAAYLIIRYLLNLIN